MYQCICQLSDNSDLFKDHVQASPGGGGGGGAELSSMGGGGGGGGGEVGYREGGWGLAQVDDRAQGCGSKVGGYHE